MRRNGSMDTQTQKYRVLEVIGDRDTPTVGEVADELDRKRNVVSATVSTLYEDDYLERTGEGGPDDPYRYELSGKGEAVLNSNESVEGDSGLGVLFDSHASDEDEESDETPEAQVETDPTPAEVERIRRENEDLRDRVDDLERRLSATCDGGDGEATISLPVADRSADLDFTTLLDALSTRKQKRLLLRKVMGLPAEGESGDMTASEEDAQGDPDRNVVSKEE